MEKFRARAVISACASVGILVTLEWNELGVGGHFSWFQTRLQETRLKLDLTVQIKSDQGGKECTGLDISLE